MLATIAIVAWAPKLTTTSSNADFLPRHYESVKAIELQDRAFPDVFNPSAIAVVQRSDGAPLTEADSTAVSGVATRLQQLKLPQVEQVVGAPPSPHQRVQTILVQMPDDNGSNTDALNDAYKKLRTQTRDLLRPAGLDVRFTGSIPSASDQEDSSSTADAIVTLTTIGLILIFLLLVFRSPIVAFLPVVLILLVSTVADGLINWAVRALDLTTDPTLSQLRIIVLFGIGTDYILFLLFRHREGLRNGLDPREAAIHAVGRAGEAVASAAAVVLFALLALSLSSLTLFRAMGPSLAIAVTVTLLASLTLVPAIIGLLGTKIFWPSRAWQHEPKGRTFSRLGAALGRRPAVFAAVAGLALVALAIPAVNYRPAFDLATGSLPADTESRQGLERLESDLPPGATSPTDVYVHSGSGTPLTEAQLTGFQEKLASIDGVGEVEPAELNADKSAAHFSVTLGWDPSSQKAVEAVQGPLRRAVHAAAPPGTEVLVGGATAIYADLDTAMKRDYRIVFPVAALIIMLILGLLLRSLVAPWFLMVSVALGFGATLGATVLVFQQVRSDQGLFFIVPMIMYMFVVAVGTDYNILMISRLREETENGLSPRAAAAEALRRSGPTIAAAGIILGGSFAVLMLAGNDILAGIGFALAFGMFLSAFVMAMFFTPAITALAGRAAWWPRGVKPRGPALPEDGDDRRSPAPPPELARERQV
ncbi:MMPL family transporter [Actinoplanes sp. NPDC004185]